MIKYQQPTAPTSLVNVIEAENLAEQVAEQVAKIVLARLAESGAIIAHQPEPEKLLKLGEAAALLGISYPTLSKRIAEGSIPTLFPGTGTPRIRLSDVRAIQKSTNKKK